MSKLAETIVWKLTDPDNYQYGREVSPGVFQFKEFDRDSYVTAFDGLKKMGYEKAQKELKAIFDKDEFWIEETVVLKSYTDKELRSYVSAYYNSLEALKEIYGKDSDFIIAECVFEQNSGQY